MNPAGKNPSRPKVVILVPGMEGGIDRLFEGLELGSGEGRGAFCFSLFETHGTMLGSLMKFPFRLLRFFYQGLRGQIDLCHINVASRGSTLRKIIYGALCRWNGVPYIIHLHGGGYRDFYKAAPEFLRRVIRRFFRQAQKVVVLGSVWRDFVTEEIGVEAGNVTILPNAVSGPEVADIAEIKKDDPPLILLLGRLGKEKGVDELVEALTGPTLSPMSWRVVLAGDGDVEKYRKIVAGQVLKERFSIPGWVGPEKVSDLLRRASILALPSHAENLPLSMLEGMAFGLCPVVTPVGAVEDVIVHGENGLLVPVGNAEALAAALEKLLNDAVLRTDLARNAHATFRSGYDFENYGARLEKVYEDVLRN